MSQGKPSLRRRLGSTVKQLQLAMRVAIDAALANRDLSMAQFAVLEVLADGGGLSCAEAARRCSITRQSMQDVVRTLHARRLIEKRSDPNNARHIVITLTAAGRRASGMAADTIRAIEEQMAQGLTPREQAQLLAWIHVCIDNLRLARSNAPKR